MDHCCFAGCNTCPGCGGCRNVPGMMGGCRCLSGGCSTVTGLTDAEFAHGFAQAVLAATQPWYCAGCGVRALADCSDPAVRCDVCGTGSKASVSILSPAICEVESGGPFYVVKPVAGYGKSHGPFPNRRIAELWRQGRVELGAVLALAEAEAGLPTAPGEARQGP